MPELDEKAREHCKKALNCTDDEIDEALLEMELKGLLVKDGNRNYELTSISERIMSMGLLSGQFKVNLVCFDCRKVILENMHGMMFIFSKHIRRPCPFCKGQLAWEPARELDWR